MPGGELVVQAPPELPDRSSGHWLARLLPLATALAAGGMVVLYVRSGAAAGRSPMFMFLPVMMLASAVGSVAHGGWAARGAALDQDRRDYLRYLDTVCRQVDAAGRDQQRSMLWTHPDPRSLWSLVGGPRMWERAPGDAGFGRVRVGIGAPAAALRVVPPDLEGPGDRDPVTAEALQRVLRHSSVVHGAPVTVALAGPRVVSVDGAVEPSRALVRTLLCELAVLHGPEHLRVAVHADAAGAAHWDWLKWLPHHGVGHTGGLDDARRVTVVDGGSPPDSGADPSTTAIVVGGCAGAADPLRITLTGGRVVVDDGAGRPAVACPDAITVAEATACARRLARFGAAERPARRRPRPNWGDLLGIDDPAALDLRPRWRTRRPTLRVPIGVTGSGDVVELDIKEAAHHGMGPHGLCIGATGSGKSEFLRTLALGMLVNHSPEELNLVLIDFKGGATFLGFDRAPHVAAVITNLSQEAQLVARMHDALAGEMTRRQELLRAAGNVADVAGYRRARDADPSLGAMPTLFIVVDEFSELLIQHPDFAELFVAIGRLGRSLGMHLLLASQRLDEGRLRGLDSHLSYRVCLKTFSASESRAVLGFPDAYELPNVPGAAYLRTESGPPVRFHTAYVSGPASPPQHCGAGGDAGPLPRRFTATPVRDMVDRPAAAPVDAPSVLDTVLGRLAGGGGRAHRVWLPPLTDSPTLDDVLGRHDARPLAVPIGLVDCPFEQRRDALVADLGAAAGNVAVVGGPRAGKSTALQTLLLGLAATASPAEVAFYCLDFGGGTLSSLRALPHVGSVAGRGEMELARRIVAEMELVLRRRERLFRDAGIESIDAYRRRRSAGDPVVAGDPFGDVFLVVDGWATLRTECESLEPAVIALALQGLSYGVHLVVAATRWAELRPALKDQMGTRLELRLGDPAESEVDRRRARLLALDRPGHGLTGEGREFVVALPRLDGDPTPAGFADAIAAAADRLRTRGGEQRAPAVELLPAKVSQSRVVAAAGAARGPLIGLGEHDLRPVALDLTEQAHLVVLGENGCGKTAVLRTLCTEITRLSDPHAAQLLIVDYRRTLLGVVESPHLGGYVASAPGLTARLGELVTRLYSRLPGEDVSQQQLRDRSWWSGPEIYLVIDDYDLVAGAAVHPLTPLLELLPHARDIGLHVVVARRSGGAARAVFDPVLSALRELGCAALLMSASPEDGALFGSVRPVRLPAGRGVLITRGCEQLVQTGWSDPP